MTGQRVTVEAPARLHFGMLDLRGERGRRFGGLGAAVPSPSISLEARRDSAFSAEGPDAERALEFARRFAQFHGLVDGCDLRIHRAIPPHAGLGSGTQLALSVGRALAELYQLDPAPAGLAVAMGRGRRSAIGTWIFEHGGLVVEGGRRPGSSALAPLIARVPMPDQWRCIIAVPEGQPGLSGEAEAAAFERLPLPEEREVERVAHVVLMQLLPALVDHDLLAFGSALTEIQEVTGAWFGPAQGGAFARGNPGELVRRLREWGAAGVGQSSWGPAVYGIVEGSGASADLARRARQLLGDRGLVVETGFANHGARVVTLPQD